MGGSLETYTNDAASNRLLSVLAGGVTRSFTYGASGNVTVDDLGGAATNLTYNAADRLVQISAGSTVLADYVYAATGRRAVKDVLGTVTHYLYDPGGALYAETDGAGAVLREYVTLGGATIAIIDATGTSYVHNDHLATPQVMTGGTAAVVWDASYRPFGEAAIAGLGANEQRFPGQTADVESGYHDNWYRTYDPSLGRYLQSDPSGLMAGFNTYAYAGSNPVMYADPTGQFLPAAILAVAGMQRVVWAIEFFVTWYYAHETLSGVVARYRAGCELRDVIGFWDVVTLVPALRYALVIKSMGRAGRGLATASRGRPPVPTKAIGPGGPGGGGSGFTGGGGGGMGPIGADGLPQQMPRYIYRDGKMNPGAFRPRIKKGEDSVSFRESLSNPYPKPKTGTVLGRDDTFVQVDTSKLPKGSVILDGGLKQNAPGHVSVKADPYVIQNAVVGKPQPWP